MGIVTWITGGLLAALIARFLPPRGTVKIPLDLGVAIASSSLLGLAATALDFGGWREADWRAAVFVTLGSLACLGALRLWRAAAGVTAP